MWQTEQQEKNAEDLSDLKHVLLTPHTHKHPHTNLLSSGRQARISSNASLDVEVALAVAAQVDGARRDVDVHQVVDNSALNVVDDTVHQVTAAHVHYLDIGQIPAVRRSVSHL